MRENDKHEDPNHDDFAPERAGSAERMNAGSEQKLSAVRRGGEATVGFARSPDGRTYICSQHVTYPFHITRPFYLHQDPPGMPSLYLQSVAGGVYEGDELSVSLETREQAQAHVTTQSSTVVHRMENDSAAQTTTLKAAAQSVLEYLPDPMVLFPLARLRNQIHVVCEDSATVMLCDGYFGHDPDGAEAPFGSLNMELVVTRPHGARVAVERFSIDGERLAKSTGYPAHGSFVCVTPTEIPPAFQRDLCANLEAVGNCYAGASTLPHDAGVCMRVMARDAQALRAAIDVAWRSLRKLLTGTEPSARPK